MISRLVRAGIAAVVLSMCGSPAFAQTPTVRLVLDFAIQGQQSPFVLAAADVTPQLREMMLVRGQTDATTALVTDLAGLERLGIAEGDLNLMRYRDFGVALYGHCILTTSDFAAKNPDTVKRVVKGFAEALKAAIAEPAVAIAAIKKREPLIDDKVERGRLELVIDNAIVTDHVKHDGLGAVDPERMKQTIEMVAKSFNIPAADVSSTYSPDYLPPRGELGLPSSRQ